MTKRPERSNDFGKNEEPKILNYFYNKYIIRENLLFCNALITILIMNLTTKFVNDIITHFLKVLLY